MLNAIGLISQLNVAVDEYKLNLWIFKKDFL